MNPLTPPSEASFRASLVLGSVSDQALLSFLVIPLPSVDCVQAPGLGKDKEKREEGRGSAQSPGVL